MTTADELRAMLAKAQRYMESAEALRQRGDHGSAISRLCYTMFLLRRGPALPDTELEKADSSLRSE